MPIIASPPTDFLLIPKDFTEATSPTPHFDAALRFLNVVVRKDQSYKARKWHPLKAQYLQQQVHRHHTEHIREALVKDGWLDCDYRYVKGKKSFCYKLGHKSMGEKIGIEVKPKRSSKPKEPEWLLPVHEWQNQMVRLAKLDCDCALAYLNKRIKPNHRDGTPQHRYWRHHLSINYFRWQKQSVYIVDERGRLYSTVSSLWKEFRRFLTLNGQRLWEVDIKNSQPLLFCKLLNNTKITYPISHSLYDTRRVSSSLFPPDVATFRMHCQDGTIYEHLMQTLDLDIPRSLFKKRFFGLFFSRNESRSQYKQAFARHFPVVADYIHQYKQEDYKQLALAVQRIEAELMIEHVAHDLMLRDIPALTIHDAILTTPEHVGEVSRRIKGHMGNLGLNCRLTAKPC